MNYPEFQSNYNMYLYKYFSLFFLVFLFSGIQAQESEELDDEQDFLVPKMSVFVTPTSLLPIPIGAIQFGFEHRLKKEKNAMYYELGYLIPSNPEATGPYDLKGMRLRAAYKRYLPIPRRTFNHFLSIQYYFQQEAWDLDGWFLVEESTFERYFDYKKNVYHNGVLLLFGGQRVGRNRSRFTMGWQFGLGAKVRTVINKGVPNGAEAINDNDQFINIIRANDPEDSGTSLRPTGHLSLRLGYIIK